jgi:hypothetical protein
MKPGTIHDAGHSLGGIDSTSCIAKNPAYLKQCFAETYGGNRSGAEQTGYAQHVVINREQISPRLEGPSIRGLWRTVLRHVREQLGPREQCSI